LIMKLGSELLTLISFYNYSLYSYQLYIQNS